MEKVLNIVIPTGASTSVTIVVSDFTYTATRMGKAPTISVQFKHPTFFQNWYSTPYVDFNNRRFYMKGTPSSSYSNEEIVYKYDAVFVADDSLERTYFIDAVQEGDQSYCSNNSKVQFWGNLADFVARLNAVIGKAGISDKYWACIDESTVTSANYPKAFEDKLISFEDKYIYDVLTDDCYNAFDVPFFLDGAYSNYNGRPSGFTGTVICFSEKNGEISTPFEYGVNKSLLSINRENANAEIITRCSGYGSSENLPWYYPNETSTGIHSFEESSGIGSHVTSINYEILGQYCNLFHPLTRLKVVQTDASTYGVELFDVVSVAKLTVGSTVIGSYTQNSRIISRTWEVSGHQGEYATITVEYYFYAPPFAIVPFLIDDSAIINYGSQAFRFNDSISLKIDGVSVTASDYISTWSPTKNADYELHTPDDGTAHRYTIIAEYTSYNELARSESTIIASFHIELFETYIDEPYFVALQYDDENQEILNKNILISESGVKFEDVTDLHTDDYVDVIGDPDSWVQPQPNLMPKIFRGRRYPEPYWDVDPWTIRFYNALNNTYPLPSSNDYYLFPNPYSDDNKHEHIESFDDIKPSIKEMVNGSGQRIDMFADIAFDADDFDQYTYNDNNEKDYEHPYFFAKLKLFNGTNGFNLFDHALDSDTMKINLTSGLCGGCVFEVMVDEETKKNPVAVDANGDLVRDDNGNVKLWKSKSDIQDRQNDTSSYSVWVALKKDVDTYGTIMPSLKNHFEVTTSDTFVITGINLPKSYIFSAEKRLEDAIIKYMYDNNSEKFKFSIDFSRIYFEEDEGAAVLPQLKEGAKISVKYPLEAENAIITYVTGITYQMSKDSHLPKVSVDLADEIVIPKSFAKQISRTISNAIAEQEEAQARKARTKTPVQQEGGGSNGMSLELILALINSSAKDQYIGMTKTQEEAALQPLEGIESIEIGEDGEFGIDENGDATLHDAEFTGDVQTDNFHDIAGQIQGAQITHAGKGTFAKLKASSFEIYELIYNRIRATGGRQAFTGAAGIVEDVTEITPAQASELVGSTMPSGYDYYILDIKKDEDAASGVHEFAYGDIVYSYVNAIGPSGSAARGGQCWGWVCKASGITEHENAVLVQLYPDSSQLPEEQLPVEENLEPQISMSITHWGNRYDNTRQTTFFIDCESGNIMQLMGVDRPIIGYNGNEGSNYGAIIGRLPADLAAAITSQTGFVINPYQPYAYLRGVIAQDFIQMDYRGKVIKAERFRGEWDSTTAAGEDPYRNTATEFHTVTHNGSLYACVLDSNTSEPGTNGNWFLLQSGAGLSMYQLRTDPTSINVRSDGSYDPQSTITAWVNKGSVGHEITQLSEQSQLDAEGLVIEYSVDGTNWTEITIGQEGDLDMENGEDVIEGEDGTPITLEVDDIDFDAVRNNSNKINFRLRRTSDDAILDSTDISVAFDGQSFFRLDVDNEMIGILLGIDNVAAYRLFSVNKPKAYYGTEDVTSGCTITFAWFGNKDSNNRDRLQANGEGQPITGSIIGITAGGEGAGTWNTGTVVKMIFTAVHPTYGTRTAEIIFNPLPYGSLLYDLAPSMNQIVCARDVDGSTIVPPSSPLKVRVRKVEGSSQTIIDVPSGYTVRYSFTGEVTTSSEGTQLENPSSTGLTITQAQATSYSNIYLSLFNGTTLVDKETIPILKDGQKGSEGTSFTPQGTIQDISNYSTVPASGTLAYQCDTTTQGEIWVLESDGSQWNQYADMASGDAYTVSDNGHMIVYNGTAWVDLGDITGRGVLMLETEYARHTSGSTAPSTGWQSSSPTLTHQYKYLWQRVRAVFTDGTYGDWVAVCLSTLPDETPYLDVDRLTIPVLTDTDGKVIAASTGTIAVKYVFNGSASSISASDVTITDSKSSGSSSSFCTKSVASNILTITYNFPANTTAANLPDWIKVSITPVDRDTKETKITIVKSQRGTVGPMGDAGPLLYPSGNYDEGTAKTGGYTNDGLTAPYVLHNNVYYWRTRNNYHAADGTEILPSELPTSTPMNPAAEYESSYVSAANKAWRPIEHYQAIWVEMLFANFGRLASWVFWGKWMFSAYGYAEGANELSEYAGYADPNDSTTFMFDSNGKWSGKWMPVYYANAETGESSQAKHREPFATMPFEVTEGNEDIAITSHFLSLGGFHNLSVQPRCNYNGASVGFPFTPNPAVIFMPNDIDVPNEDGAKCTIIHQFDEKFFENGVANEYLGELSAVVVCADARILDPDAQPYQDWQQTSVVPTNAFDGDSEGWFIWKGHKSKFIILMVGGQLRLRCCQTKRGNFTSVYWYVENGDEFVELPAYVEVTKTESEITEVFGIFTTHSRSAGGMSVPIIGSSDLANIGNHSGDMSAYKLAFSMKNAPTVAGDVRTYYIGSMPR